MAANELAQPWELSDLGDQSGRTFVVTGANSGVGYHAALELARVGGRVVVAGRSPDRVCTAVQELRNTLSDQADPQLISALAVDLSDLSSVTRAAETARHLGPIDVLVNNAGIMATSYARTPDGLEQQLATNHFGPFLLTGLLLPQLRLATAGRMVVVSSNLHKSAKRPPLADPRADTSRTYSRWQVYAQTKLANLLFMTEFNRRCAELGVVATGAHPGTAATNLIRGRLPGQTLGAIGNAAIRLLGQPAADGALPTLMAACADLPPNSYCGPSGAGEVRGKPRLVSMSALAQDRASAKALWEMSESVTGLRWPEPEK